MEASKAWDRIVRSIRYPAPVALETFERVIRKRHRKKKYGSFRVPEYEDILLQDKLTTLKYAKFIVIGKLPEKMHRRMLAWAIEDPNNPLIKEYFDVCEGKKNYERPLGL